MVACSTLVSKEGDSEKRMSKGEHPYSTLSFWNNWRKITMPLPNSQSQNWNGLFFEEFRDDNPEKPDDGDGNSLQPFLIALWLYHWKLLKYDCKKNVSIKLNE